MARKKKDVVEEVKTNAEVIKEGGNMKMQPKEDKPKTKTEVSDDGTVKIDLSKATTKKQKDDVVKVDLSKKEEPKEQPKEEVVQEVEEPKEKVEEKEPVVEEITEVEIEEKTKEVKEEVVEAIQESKQTGNPLPENIQKVVDFMEDTGGSLEDYVQLNKDYSKLTDHELLHEHFKQTKPHLNDEERSFVIEDLYSYDEDAEEERDVKRKKLALKEQVASAKSHLDGLKSKYYEEVKAGSKLTQDQQKAVDFFNRYSETQEVASKNQTIFEQKTNTLFNEEFKGFEYRLGEKRFRLNINEAQKVKEKQLNINNFVDKFLDKETQQVNDAKGYHKSLFTAMNPDLVANHFYQQGKADAIKDSMAKAKNVDMSPNQTHPNAIESGGIKVRAISGETSNDFKVKVRRNPNKIS